MDDAMTEMPIAGVGVNALHRMGERVAAMEERVNGIVKSVEVIRATDHEINGHMQRFVLAEQGCQQNLVILTGQVGKLTESIAPLAEGVREFQRMHADLLEVMQGYERRRGVASFGRKLGAIVASIAGLFTLIASLVLGIIWVAQHIQVRLPS